ncbi:hypothetical protein [Streptomyces mexicanus]|jgi:hypothetical protein|uniref:hypothetical protein n=1 Tax=Streptomyces mexicanus TaxID=178566 RepID=UPI0031E6BB53
MFVLSRIRTTTACAAVVSALVAGLGAPAASALPEDTAAVSVRPGHAEAAASVAGTVIAEEGLAVRRYYPGTPTPFTYAQAPVNYYLSYNDTVTISCWLEGPTVTGPYGATNAWDVVYRSEGHLGVASDAWIYTGADIRTQVNKCAGTIARTTTAEEM